MRFAKSPAEKKLYTVDYSRWLQASETLIDFAVTVLPTTEPALESSGAFITQAGKALAFYLAGGTDATTYEVHLVAQTSDGQTKEDVLILQVLAP